MTDPKTMDMEMALDSHIADALEPLDRLAHKAERPRDRIAALSAKLRFLEMRRHHLHTTEMEEKTRSRMATAVEDLVKALRDQLQADREPPPGHTRARFRGMGLTIEASGKEDDPLFQKIALTIDEISHRVASLTEDEVAAERRERERERA